MSKLDNLAKITRLLTSSELRQIANSEVAGGANSPTFPCPVCGSPIFAVESTGQFRCAGCMDDDDLDRFTRRRFALHLIVIVMPDGRRVWRELEHQHHRHSEPGGEPDGGDEILAGRPGRTNIQIITSKEFGTWAVWYNRDGSRTICRQSSIRDGPTPGEVYADWWDRQPRIIEGTKY